MKEYKISLGKGETAYVKGTVHNLILKNGEKVKVIAHRPFKEEEKYWCITDMESGYQICGTTEYHYFICPSYFCGIDTKERALFTAVSKLNEMVVKNGKTFADKRKERMEVVQNGKV